MYSKHLIKTASHLSAPLRVGAALLLVALALSVWPTPVAYAATIVVSTTADTVDANGGVCVGLTIAQLPGPDGFTSLREAVCAANTEGGADIITLSTTTYTLTGASGEDANVSGDLDITDDLTINGAAGGGTIIDGNQVDRVLHIGSGATVVVNDVEISNGKAPDGADNASGAGSDGSDGGGIYNAGTLALNDCTVSENAAGDGGDGGGGGYDGGDGGDGGGIYNAGTLTLEETTVDSNTAGTGGLCSGDGTSGRGGYGGGIYHSLGSLTLTGSDLIDNTAGNGGAAGTGTEGNGGYGGGIYVWPLLSMTLTDCTVSGNAAGDGRSGGNGGGIENRGVVAITDSTISGNDAGDSHGSTSGGGDGGGIASSNAGSALTLLNSTVSGNTAGDGYHGGDGAGIYTYVTTVVMTGTTVSDNTGGTNAGGNGSEGGGIYVDLSTTMAATNSTISGNSVEGRGGGIENYGNVTLSSCTIADNTADSDSSAGSDRGGGIYNGSGGVVSFMNTIIADNADLSGAGPDCYAPSSTTFTSLDYNLIEDLTGCSIDGSPANDITGFDPNLGALIDNGGPTWTQALGAGSLAIDHIPNGTNGCVGGTSVDQRGAVRAGEVVPGDHRGGTACDVGAYEYDSDETPNAVTLRGFVAGSLWPLALVVGATVALGGVGSAIVWRRRRLA